MSFDRKFTNFNYFKCRTRKKFQSVWCKLNFTNYICDPILNYGGHVDSFRKYRLLTQTLNNHRVIFINIHIIPNK